MEERLLFAILLGFLLCTSQICTGNHSQSLHPILYRTTIPGLSDDPHLDEIDAEHATCNGIDLREITITALQNLFQTGKLSSVELTKCYLNRIRAMNPVLKAVIEVNPNAIKQARTADKERKVGANFGKPMHGIPVLVKDNIAIRDGMETTAGSWALVGAKPVRDSAVGRSLKANGAVILGKANLSEMSYFRGTNVSAGWSGRGGQTRNPYNLNVSPLGSSSGSAVAVAANLAMVSVGTETDGSLTAPASVGGVFTLKPTQGRVISIGGVIPISYYQDAVGPMARTVMDLAILLDALRKFTATKGGHCEQNNYAQCLLYEDGHDRSIPLRVGVLRYPFWDTSVIKSSFLEEQLPQLEELLDNMKNSSRFKVFDPVFTTKEAVTAVNVFNEFLVLFHDFKHDINLYLQNDVESNSTNIKSLTDIIQFNKDNPSPEMYNQEFLEMAEATDGIHNKTYVDAREQIQTDSQLMLDTVFEKYNLDAIVTPSEARYQGVFDDDFENAPMQGYSFASISGYPSMTIPAGIDGKGVPFGVTLIGQTLSENKLLRIAYNMEKLGTKRRPPQFYT